MPKTETPQKKQSWRFTSLKNLRPAPRRFLHYPAPMAIGSFVYGEQLLVGQFAFAGQLVKAPDTSIWNVRPPSHSYLDALQGFDWLNDLAAIGDSAARKRAQRWLLEWIEAFGHSTTIGWQPDLAARRLVNWCFHAQFLLKGLDKKPTTRVFKSLGRHVNFLSNNWKATPQGLGKFEVLSGMVYAGLALEGCEYALHPGLKGLSAECQGWIGPAGEIPSRNPEELSGVFTRLTWITALLAESGQPENPDISAALARIAPGLRALRLGDGTLARFHGGGHGREGQLDQALADAQIRNGAAKHSFMGYERLSAGRVVLVLDAAPPPKTSHAHTSALGFEMSAGLMPFLASSGPGTGLEEPWASACAQCAAHNTLTIEGAGAEGAEISVERAHDLESTWLSASTRGFVERFGVIHERRLLVASDGGRLSGEDRLFPADPDKAAAHPADVLSRPRRGHSFMLHFHLHPDVVAKAGESSIALALPNGEIWRFRQEGGLSSLEPSVCLDPSHIGPRATKQIIVTGRSLDYVGAIRWSFTKV